MSVQRFKVLMIVMGIAAIPQLNAFASSHREAPFITQSPKVDATDFYLFNSYEPGRSGFVTIIANYLPLQDPYGGPNYFTLDPEARYEIHIDNDGDAHADLTFRFELNQNLAGLTVSVGGINVPVPLINIGSIGPTAGDTAALNVSETFTIRLIREHGSSKPIKNAITGASVFKKPVDNIGNKSIPSYSAYASDHVYEITLPGTNDTGRVFVGQRKDSFVVNLGETFDLVNTDPLGLEAAEPDDLADKNITSFILELPVSFLLAQSNDDDDDDGTVDPVIGGWTTASLPRIRLLKNNPTFDDPSAQLGQFIQLSRLAMPLVNEVVIGLPDKDRFNASEPSDDGQFLVYVTNPTLPVLLQILFGVTPPCLPRNDLVAVFLTGVPGLNQPANVTPAEMMRLNTGIPAVPLGSQSRLGVLGGDLAGFPNGRRPGDDVVDIELRAVMGALYPDAGDPNGCAPFGDLPFTDGAFLDDSFFSNAFPYLLDPLPGSPN